MEQNGADNEEVFHLHCYNCIKVLKCTVRSKIGESCDIITCDLDCGSRFHACKKHEHHLLCPNLKVPCINAVYGCPAQLPRHQLGPHLKSCPASVVHCTIEWNRWPVFSKGRQQSRPPHQPLCHLQLDVALALRDQRMLSQWWRAPRKTKKALCNPLTRKYPAVPLHPYRGNNEAESSNPDGTQVSQNVSDDDSDAPWEVKKTPPGLQRSVCGELYRASRQTTETLAAALNMITGPSSACNGETKILHNGCCCMDINLNQDQFSMHENKENTPHHKVTCNGSHHCLEEDWYSEVSSDSDLSGMDIDGDGCLQNGSCNGHGAVFSNRTVLSEIIASPLLVSLGLDLNLESITRYQAKPKSMYTFLCAQEFRRDEYAWHYKNVHSDIHGGLNGWLEQRCPLAQYGCTFSRRRFYPSPQGSVIVHSDVLESFGLKLPSPVQNGVNGYCDKNGHGRMSGRPDKYQKCGNMEIINENSQSTCNGEVPTEIQFSQLPFEILQHIARFLDSFSLCNLALVSRLMRDVCCSLLEERGMVVFQWEKRKNSWQVAYKRWFFSTAFSPIQRWSFEDDYNMSNHLKHCVFFQRNIKTDPFFCLTGSRGSPNAELLEKLRASAKAANRMENENMSTKL